MYAGGRLVQQFLSKDIYFIKFLPCFDQIIQIAFTILQFDLRQNARTIVTQNFL